MSAFPGLTAVIEAEVARFNIRAASQYELADAIARAVVEFATTRDARQRMTKAYFDCDGTPVDALVAAIRAALGEENTDG